MFIKKIVKIVVIVTCVIIRFVDFCNCFGYFVNYGKSIDGGIKICC